MYSPLVAIEQMHAGDVAFAALGRLESGHAADGEELRSHTALLQLAEQVVEADAVAADDDEIGQLQLAIEQLHGDHRARRDDLVVAADRGEAVGAAERRDAAGALAHGIGGERGRFDSSVSVGSLKVGWRRRNQTNQEVLGAADLAVHADGQPRLHGGALLRRRAARHRREHRCDELVKREDRGRRKARQHDDRRPPVAARQIGLPGFSATPCATMPGSVSSATTR